MGKKTRFLLSESMNLRERQAAHKGKPSDKMDKTGGWGGRRIKYVFRGA